MKIKRLELSKEIARLTCKYRKIEEVACIYLLPVKNNNGLKIYELVIVCSSPIEDLEKNYKDYNLLNRHDSKIREYGGRLNITLDSPRFYVRRACTQIEIDKTRSLRSSNILFDRTGFYKQVAEDESVSRYDNCFRFHISKRLLLENNKQDKQ